MSQELLGNVFEPGQKSLLCRLEVDRTSVRAIEHLPAEGAEARRFEFPLRAETLSFSGDGGSVVLLEAADGVKLYCDRVRLEPPLRSAGLAPDLLLKLGGEGVRVAREGRNAHAWLLAFTACLVLGVVAAFALANWTVDRVIDRIPVSWEATLGEAVVSGLGYPEVSDPRVKEPVQAVLDRVLAATGEQPYSFTLHVVESPDINAMAAPGGQIIVFTGLLEKADGPDELAGVLGHEIQHVLGRHSLRNMVHAVKWQIAASMLLGDLGTVQSLLLAKAPDLLSLSYGRGLEEEADLEGARLLLKADIDPQGLSKFFRLLEQQQGMAGAIPEFLSSHPETGSRIEAIEAFLNTQPEADGSYTAIEADWAGMKKALEE